MDLIKQKDSDLMRIIAEGNAESGSAFMELYRRYSGRIYRYCLFKVSIRENAEEIFQETWVKFNNAIKNGFAIENVAGYLSVIASNQIREFYRRNKNNLQEVRFEDYDWEKIVCPTDFAAGMENQELIGLIKVAVSDLDEKYREPFILNKFNEMNYAEIGEILGESTECIKKRVYRAMDMIKKTLQPYINELSNN